jgi:PKD repeat protein
MATPDSSHSGTVHFSTTPLAGPHLVWNFGDGSSGSGANVSHTYNSLGPFNVCVTELDSAGRILCNYCDTVYPNGNPISCSFTYTTDPHDSLGLIFTASGSSNLSVHWDYGDGSTGTGNTSSHSYPSAGNYIVCMTVVDTSSGTGITCTSCFPVVISGGHASVCSFTASSSPAGGGAIVFTATSSTGSGSTINWSFGDGHSGQGNTVTHNYQSSGLFQVCMTETNNLGTILCTYCDTIAVNVIPGNNCHFTYTGTSASYLDILFSAQATSTGTMTWDFGDGSTGTGTTVNHTYAADGIYNVCNTLTDSAGNILCHTCQLVNIRNPHQPACDADFQAVSLGLMGYFIDLSTVDPATASYSWDFGDGNSSTLRFPQHQYSAPGAYTVCLNVADSNCTDQYCSTLVVDTTINNPVFCNSFFVTLQMAPYQLTVVNMSSGINLSFNWDFGDGTTSTQHYPSHTYASTGTYLLCLTVSGGGCTSTFCDTVSVDSTGRINRMANVGFTINVVSPDQLTGIDNIPTQNFVSIYPNPVKEMLNVQIDSRSVSTYRILNINGAEVTSGSFNSDKNTLKTSTWDSGFYLLEITREDGVRNYKKIVKE